MWTHIKEKPDALIALLKGVPYSETSFRNALVESPDPLEQAARTFTRFRQSFGGKGKDFARPSGSRLRRGMPDNESAWHSALELIPANARRLKGVKIQCVDALELLEEYKDVVEALFYLDPPYVPETRTVPRAYESEMTLEQHEKLLQLCRGLKGSVILSGYRSELYTKYLGGWEEVDIPIKNQAAVGKKKRGMVETLWVSDADGLRIE